MMPRQNPVRHVSSPLASVILSLLAKQVSEPGKANAERFIESLLRKHDELTAKKEARA